MAKVRKKVVSNDANDGSNYNPILDSSVYEVQFNDGTTDEVAANVIVECMLSQVDSEGHHYQILKEISNHKALSISEGFHMRKGSNQKIPKKMTRGWELLIEWRANPNGEMDQWIGSD